MKRAPLSTGSMAGSVQDARLSSPESFQRQLRGYCTPLNIALDSATPLLLFQSDEVMDLACFLPLFHHSHWENPRESIGEPIGRLRNGRYQCWHVTGPALKANVELGRELQEYIATCPKSGTVIWGMYMVGHREDNAAPKLLICSTEQKTRKTIRRMVRKSKILDKYPGIGLGDASSLPDRGVIVQMAKDAIEKILPPGCDMTRDKAILIEGSETAPGKRIYTVNSDGETMHAATSGPFVFINDTWCQLTVSHPFFATHPCVSNQREVPDPVEDDCEFEDMSDVGEDEDEADLEATTRASVSSFSIHEQPDLVEDWLASPSESQDDSYLEGDVVSEAETYGTISNSEPSNRSHSVATTVHDSLEGMEGSTQRTPASAQQMDLNMSRLQYLGKLGLASDELEESPLDYALVVINNGHIPQLTAPQFINPQLIITKSFPAIDLVEETSPWKDCVREIGLDFIDVVTLTPTGGPVSGKLIPNPSYLRIANQSSFYRVFPLALELMVSGGDCGSPVFDESGRFCGHIVAGGVRTSHAYIIPASDIFNDLESRIWGKISMPNEAHMRVSKPIGTPEYALSILDAKKVQHHVLKPASPLVDVRSSESKELISDQQPTPEELMVLESHGTRGEEPAYEQYRCRHIKGGNAEDYCSNTMSTSDPPATTEPNQSDDDGGSATKWNDQQIHNAFQVARSLAPIDFGPDTLHLVRPSILHSPPHIRHSSHSNEGAQHIPKPINPMRRTEEDIDKETTKTIVAERQIAPPPHLRKHISTFDPRPRGSIAAALRQATLGIVNPMGLSALELLTSGTSSGGLTVVLAKGELFDDLEEGGQDPTVMRSSLTEKAMEVALRVAASVADHTKETSLTHQDHYPGVRDKLRSKSKFGRWKSQSTHSHDSKGRYVPFSWWEASHDSRDAAFHHDLGVME